MNQLSVTTGARIWIKIQDKEQRVRERLNDDRGATTIEYVLIAAGVAALAIGLVVAIRAVVGDSVANIPTDVNTTTTLGG